MKIRYIIIFVFINTSLILNAQDYSEVEVSEGVFLVNALKHSNNIKKDHSALGLKSDFTFWRVFDFERSFKGKAGLGYSNFYYLKEETLFNIKGEEVSSTSYLTISLGITKNSFWSPMKYTFHFDNYLLLLNKKQDENQDRLFSNLDLGLEFKINNKMNFHVSTPIPLQPISSGRYAVMHLEKWISYNLWAETLSLSIGVTYRLN